MQLYMQNERQNEKNVLFASSFGKNVLNLKFE